MVSLVLRRLRESVVLRLRLMRLFYVLLANVPMPDVEEPHLDALVRCRRRHGDDVQEALLASSRVIGAIVLYATPVTGV